MNLYLYIPPHSAHPPGMIKGLIYGQLQRYKYQNSDRADYLIQIKLLYQRLRERGWQHNTLQAYFIEAAKEIERKSITRNPEKSSSLSPKERAFLHIQYHPHDIPRCIIRKIYEKNCPNFKDFYTNKGGKMDIKQLTIAFSRPKNIRDTLTNARLYQPKGKEVTKYMLGEV